MLSVLLRLYASRAWRVLCGQCVVSVCSLCGWWTGSLPSNQQINLFGTLDELVVAAATSCSSYQKKMCTERGSTSPKPFAAFIHSLVDACTSMLNE